MGLEHLDPKNAIHVLKKIKQYLSENGKLHIIVYGHKRVHMVRYKLFRSSINSKNFLQTYCKSKNEIKMQNNIEF
jgi:hypothetical protein